MRKLKTPEFQALLEAAPDAMVIIDRDGIILQINAQAEKLFGHQRDELLGKQVEILIPDGFRQAHPAHRKRYFSDARPWPMGAAGVELFGRRKDGTEFPAEVSLSPMKSDEGGLTIAAIRDGTARQRVEDKFRRLMEAAPDAMVIADREGRIVLANAQALALFRYTQEELLGQAVEVLIPDRYRAAHPAHRRGYFDGPRKRPMGAGRLALFGRRKDGTEFPAEISLSPLETDDGVLAITAIQDITDRKKAEDERLKLDHAQEALRMRDEFLSIASHELKTPLTALLMQVDAILRLGTSRSNPAQPALSDTVIARVQKIRQGTRRLNKLIDQLLDLSRLTAGKFSIEREEVDVAALVRNVAAQFQDELRQARCELELHLPDSPLLGHWDPLRLEQIISNLLSNAVKYGQGNPIEVTLAAAPNQRIRMTVRDHGIGIAPEHQARIFERFERIVSSRNYGGFGLGLWIIRQIIEAHGGNIQVWSQPGAGSTFTVELPQIGIEQPARASLRSQDDQMVILLIDDDPLIRSSFSDALQDEGFIIATAADGREALECLRGGIRPNVILLDLMMPGMDGASFRAEQQKDPLLAAIPVVVLSASSDIVTQADALGVQAHLKKPVELDALLQTIGNFHELPGAPTAS